MQLPSVYLVRSKLSASELQSVVQALEITPVACVVVTDSEDHEQALQLSEHILRSYEEPNDARLLLQLIGLAGELEQPIAIIGGYAPALSAVTVKEDGAPEITEVPLSIPC